MLQYAFNEKRFKIDDEMTYLDESIIINKQFTSETSLNLNQLTGKLHVQIPFHSRASCKNFSLRDIILVVHVTSMSYRRWTRATSMKLLNYFMTVSEQ